MPVTLVGTPVTAATSKDNGGSGWTPIVKAITVPAGANLLIATVRSAFGSSGTTDLIAYNGVGMTLYQNPVGASNNGVFYRLNPTVGTYNLTVNCPTVNSGGCLIMTAACFAGVDTAAPFSGWVDRSAMSGNPSVFTSAAIPTVANGLCMLFNTAGGTGTYTAPAWTANAPSYLAAQVSSGFNDGSKQNTKFEGVMRQAGTGGNVTFSASSPYGFNGNYYTFNLLPQIMPVSTQVIFFF
jgi:hypothetical protein